jgi:ABC-2 type transport system permease protein
MKATANPLIVKEVKERFRSMKTVWILCSYLFVMGAVFLGFIYIETANRLTFRPGENMELFIALSVIQLGMIGFITPALSAGTISGERERQTLNLLLTTHLSPLSIVTSKLITSLAFIMLLLLASLPLYSFVFLYGGISPNQLLSLFLFFGVNVVFFGSLGLFCSAWIKRTGVATITAYGFTFFIGVGTGLLAIFIHELYSTYVPGQRAEDLLGFQIFMSLNPGIVLLQILMGEGKGPINAEFNPWLVFSAVYSVLSVLFILASGAILNPLRKIRLRKEV